MLSARYVELVAHCLEVSVFEWQHYNESLQHELDDLQGILYWTNLTICT